MSYTIDVPRRLVLTKGWDVVSTRDLQEIMSRIVTDPRFQPEYRSLADLSDVTDVTVDSMALAEAASMPIFAATTRRAIVATRDAVYGMGRMFASFAARSGQEVRVFRHRDIAMAWLDGAAVDTTDDETSAVPLQSPS